MIEKKKATEAYERYTQIILILQENDDKNGLKLVDELIHKIAFYFKAVTKFEAFIGRNKYNSDRLDYQEITEELDRKRRLCHEAMLAQLNIVNRYLFKTYGTEKIPIGGIYSLDSISIKDRSAVADWAGYLAEALYNRKIIEK